MASGCSAPHQQVEHMAAPTSPAEPFKSPLPKESRPHMANIGDLREIARSRFYGVEGDPGSTE